MLRCERAATQLWLALADNYRKVNAMKIGRYILTPRGPAHGGRGARVGAPDRGPDQSAPTAMTRPLPVLPERAQGALVPVQPRESAGRLAAFDAFVISGRVLRHPAGLLRGAPVDIALMTVMRRAGFSPPAVGYVVCICRLAPEVGAAALVEEIAVDLWNRWLVAGQHDAAHFQWSPQTVAHVTALARPLTWGEGVHARRHPPRPLAVSASLLEYAATLRHCEQNLMRIVMQHDAQCEIVPPRWLGTNDSGSVRSGCVYAWRADAAERGQSKNRVYDLRAEFERVARAYAEALVECASGLPAARSRASHSAWIDDPVVTRQTLAEARMILASLEFHDEAYRDALEQRCEVPTSDTRALHLAMERESARRAERARAYRHLGMAAELAQGVVDRASPATPEAHYLLGRMYLMESTLAERGEENRAWGTRAAQMFQAIPAESAGLPFSARVALGRALVQWPTQRDEPALAAATEAVRQCARYASELTPAERYDAEQLAAEIGASHPLAIHLEMLAVAQRLIPDPPSAMQRRRRLDYQVQTVVLMLRRASEARQVDGVHRMAACQAVVDRATAALGDVATGDSSAHAALQFYRGLAVLMQIELVEGDDQVVLLEQASADLTRVRNTLTSAADRASAVRWLRGITRAKVDHALSVALTTLGSLVQSRDPEESHRLLTRALAVAGHADPEDAIAAQYALAVTCGYLGRIADAIGHLADVVVAIRRSDVVEQFDVTCMTLTNFLLADMAVPRSELAPAARAALCERLLPEIQWLRQQRLLHDDFASVAHCTALAIALPLWSGDVETARTLMHDYGVPTLGHLYERSNADDAALIATLESLHALADRVPS